MDSVKNVYWIAYHDDALARGYWDNALISDIFDRGNFIHREIKNQPFPDIPEGEGGVVVINGRSHINEVERLNEDIAKLHWCLLIITGDEEALFKWQEVRHPNFRIWVMLPRIGLHNDVSFKMPNGYAPQIHDHLPKEPPEKTLDFFFAGQITHERRFEMARSVEHLLRNGANGGFHPSKGFTQGLPHDIYYDGLASAKIALCPSGPETPDSFRLYEALEAGCLPIVDAFATNNKEWGFWKYLFGEELPFPVIDYWENLPKMLPELLKDYPHNANKAQAWWLKYKRDMFNKLLEDIKVMST